MNEETPRQGVGAGLLGWAVTLAVGALLISGAYDSLDRELTGRWLHLGFAGGFVALHILALATSIGGLTRGVASVLFLCVAVAVYQARLGPLDSTDFAWSDVPLRWLHHGLLLWWLGLGGAVLVVAPKSAAGRLGIGLPVALLLTPWAAGFAMGWTDGEILTGPQWLAAVPWFVQPATLALALLGPVALFSLVLTAAGAERGGEVRPGARAVAWGLALLLLAVPTFAVRHQLAEPSPPEGMTVTIPGVGGVVMPPGVTVTTSTPGAGAMPPGVTVTTSTGGSDGTPEVTMTTHPPGSPGAPPAGDRAPLPESAFDCATAIRPDQDLSDLRDGFRAATWRTTALKVLDRRYPDAAWVVGSLDDPTNFDVWFTGHGTGSWDAVIAGLSAAVHEDVHMVGFSGFRPGYYHYVMAKDAVLSVQVVRGFDRSLVSADLAPPASTMSYRSTYLEGDSGAQGLDTLLDEFNAYTWSLLVETALLDQARNTSSARDGLLSMMYYTELYLLRARTSEPDVHRAIVQSDEMRSTIVTLWDRAICALELSGTDRRLGIQDRELWPLVFEPTLLAELDRLREQ